MLWVRKSEESDANTEPDSRSSKWKRVHWFWCPSLRALDSRTDRVIYLDKDGFLLTTSGDYSCYWRDHCFRRATKAEASSVDPRNAKPRDGVVHGLHVRRRRPLPSTLLLEDWMKKPWMDEAMWLKQVYPHEESSHGPTVIAWDKNGKLLNPEASVNAHLWACESWFYPNFREATKAEQAEWLLFTEGQAP